MSIDYQLESEIMDAVLPRESSSTPASMSSANQVRNRDKMSNRNPIYSFYALRRSGHHAIMNWILWGHRRPVLLWNNREQNDNRAIHSGKLQIMLGSYKATLIKSVGMPLWTSMPLAARYENFEDGIIPVDLDTEHSIIIVRDFYNNMASRLKWERDVRSRYRADSERDEATRTEMDKSKILWKSYAIAALSHQHEHACILYDSWVTNDSYREEVEQRLGITGSRKALAITAQYGPGSSFEGMHGCPDAQRLLNRYEKFKNDKFFTAFCQDAEILSLNRSLFGSTASNQWAESLKRTIK